MTEETKPQTRETGVMVTLRDIYNSVKEIDNKLDDELGKLKTQVAAQWVIHGIMVAAIVSLVTRGIGG